MHALPRLMNVRATETSYSGLRLAWHQLLVPVIRQEQITIYLSTSTLEEGDEVSWCGDGVFTQLRLRHPYQTLIMDTKPGKFSPISDVCLSISCRTYVWNLMYPLTALRIFSPVYQSLYHTIAHCDLREEVKATRVKRDPIWIEGRADCMGLAFTLWFYEVLFPTKQNVSVV